ncbi:hypothetical protein Lal_00033426 [Lupinus albus]|nr:hypothetical protein Lal_00033426 [Lupinus albus]
MVKNKIFVLDEDLFLEVGGLSSSGEPLGDYNNEKWNSFESVATYESCLRYTFTVTPRGLTNVGALTVENRLLHYIMAYILVQRSTNHAQPTTNDLKMMFAIKKGIAFSSSKLLAYGIFISRVIDHMVIDTFDVEVKLTNSHDHLLGAYLIHKMGIYWLGGTWMYQEDYKTTVDLNLSNDELPAGQEEKPTTQPEAAEASQAPPFGVAHLYSLEQLLNQRLDIGLQTLHDSLHSELMNLYDRVAADIQRETDQNKAEIDKITFMLQSLVWDGMSFGYVG